MNSKFVLSMLCTLLVMVLMTSCGGEEGSSAPKLSVSTQNITLVADQLEEQLKVNAEGSWQFAALPTWLTVNPPRGTGNATVTLTVTSNVTNKERSATFRLESAESNSKKSINITIVQPPSDKVWAIQLSKGEISLERTTKVRLTAKVYPDNASNQKVEWISEDTTIATIDSTGLITAVKAGNTNVYAKATDGSGTKSDGCSVRVEELYEWVDLKLPSGTLWAAHNIGASNALQPGYYYAWGDSRAYPSEKKNFVASTYSLYNSSTQKYKRYVTNSNWGTVDNLTTLRESDNTALTIWGSHWTIPTEAQFQELLNNCSWTPIKSGVEVKGWMVTSNTNGKQLIFPLTGYVGSELVGIQSYGYFWTRQLDTSYNPRAKVFSVTVTSHTMGNLDRCIGFTIRPVRNN